MSDATAKQVLMGIMTRVLKEHVELFRAGFNSFEPDDRSMKEIERCAGALWEAYNSAVLIELPRTFYYAKKAAKSDVAFQSMISKITSLDGAS